jgi:phage I-like protein
MEPKNQRRYNGGHSGGVSNAVIFHAIEELKEELTGVKSTVNDLTRRFDALPETFTPRPEAVQITDRLRDKQAEQDRRIADLERWRTEQTERQHQAELAAMATVNGLAKTTTAQVTQVATTTTAAVDHVRSAQDSRLINLLAAGFGGLLTTILGYLLAHVIR